MTEYMTQNDPSRHLTFMFTNTQDQRQIELNAGVWPSTDKHSVLRTCTTASSTVSFWIDNMCDGSSEHVLQLLTQSGSGFNARACAAAASKVNM